MRWRASRYAVTDDLERIVEDTANRVLPSQLQGLIKGYNVDLREISYSYPHLADVFRQSVQDSVSDLGLRVVMADYRVVDRTNSPELQRWLDLNEKSQTISDEHADIEISEDDVIWRRKRATKTQEELDKIDDEIYANRLRRDTERYILQADATATRAHTDSGLKDTMRGLHEHEVTENNASAGRIAQSDEELAKMNAGIAAAREERRHQEYMVKLGHSEEEDLAARSASLRKNLDDVAHGRAVQAANDAAYAEHQQALRDEGDRREEYDIHFQ